MTQLQEPGWGWLERCAVALLSGWSARLSRPTPSAAGRAVDAGLPWSEQKVLHGVRPLSLLPGLSGPPLAGGAALGRGGRPFEPLSETPG
jgi:hypothetical protein